MSSVLTLAQLIQDGEERRAAHEQLRRLDEQLRRLEDSMRALRATIDTTRPQLAKPQQSDSGAAP